MKVMSELIKKYRYVKILTRLGNLLIKVGLEKAGAEMLSKSDFIKLDIAMLGTAGEAPNAYIAADWESSAFHTCTDGTPKGGMT